MEENLISKKELLTLTGISYGQLYRWKRKNIIPETWFIKKSVPSGQETFFPREKVLERIDSILNMKEEASLDDLAKMFSVEVEEHAMDIEKLIKNKVLCERSIELHKSVMKQEALTSLQDIIGVKLLKEQVISGNLTLEEGKVLLAFIEKHFNSLTGENARIYLYRNMGVAFVIGTEEKDKLCADENYKQIVEINLYEDISTIKFELMR